MDEIGWMLAGAALAWAGLRLVPRRPQGRTSIHEPARERPAADTTRTLALDRTTAEIRSNLLLALENAPAERDRPEAAELERAIAAATELTLQLLHLRNGLFPLPALEPSRAMEGAAGVPTGTETILVVDDEAGVRALARRTLERLGYVVFEAADAIEALALLEQSGDVVDLVVTDVLMPQMSGFELVQRMRERWPLVRILYISGAAQPDDERQGLALLPKPFTPEQLTQSVRTALDALPDPGDATPPPLPARP
ncbi:MAG TPA: response regulator [Longimicrobiales bacterium]